MNRLTSLFLLLSAASVAQAQSPVTLTGAPPPAPYTKILGYDASNNLTYVCTAQSYQQQRLNTAVSISTISKASAAVVTSTAHGFPTGSRASLTIAGATGTGWSIVNTTTIATVTGADTFTIPIDTSGVSGTLGGTITFTTAAPRTGVAEWSIQRFAYDASNNLIWAGWQSGTSSMNQTCSTASSTTNNIQ